MDSVPWRLQRQLPRSACHKVPQHARFVASQANLQTVTCQLYARWD